MIVKLHPKPAPLCLVPVVLLQVPATLGFLLFFSFTKVSPNPFYFTLFKTFRNRPILCEFCYFLGQFMLLNFSVPLGIVMIHLFQSYIVFLYIARFHCKRISLCVVPSFFFLFSPKHIMIILGRHLGAHVLCVSYKCAYSL